MTRDLIIVIIKIHKREGGAARSGVDALPRGCEGEEAAALMASCCVYSPGL